MSEPRPLCFNETPPPAKRLSADTACGPKPLVLPEEPKSPTKPVPPAGAPLFGTAAHPAQSSAERAAKDLDAGFYAAQAGSIARRITQLLPLGEPALQDFAARPLAAGRELALTVAALTQRLAALDATALLASALRSVTGGKGGLLGMVREKLAPSPASYIPKVTAMQQALRGLRSELKPVRVGAQETDVRLRVHLVALRAVEQVAGRSSNTVLADLIQRKLDVLRASTTQAQLSVAQADQLDQTIAGLLAQCEQLLSVTLSAGALVQAGGR